jgi:ketosteroid isomerase-like protein
MIRKLAAIIISTLSSLYLLSCNSDNTKQPTNQTVEQPMFDMQRAKSFIDSINAKFSEQFAAGDSVALASHYWPDAELLLDNSEPVKGNDILNAWGSASRAGIKEISFVTTNITGDSSFLIETGNYEMKDAKKSPLDKGKYVVVWQNRNGEWKLYRDIGSTSMTGSK